MVARRGSRVLALSLCVALASLTAISALASQTASAAGREIDSEYLGIAPGRFNNIKAADVDRDGAKEIFFGNYDGYISAIRYRDGDYSAIWRGERIGPRAWGVEAGDADGDGTSEVYAGDGDGYIYRMNFTTGAIEWKSEFLGRDVHGIRIADCNGDGKKEIIAGTGFKTDFPAGKVCVFDGSTRGLLLDLSFNESKHRALQVADVDQDGSAEIVIGSGISQGERPGAGYIRIVDGKTGRLEWQSPDLNGDVEGLAVADLDGSGAPEIIGGTGYRYQEGYVFVFSYRNATKTYERVWKSDNVGPKAFGLAVGDIDGDGAPEIASGNQPGYMRIYDGRSFALEWKSPLLGTDVLGIAIADVDGDGAPDVIAAQGGYDGKGDFTSAYTAPHIYIIDGKTHEIKRALGELDYITIAFQVAIVALLIALLLSANYYAGLRRKAKSLRKGGADSGDDERGGGGSIAAAPEKQDGGD